MNRFILSFLFAVVLTTPTVHGQAPAPENEPLVAEAGKVEAEIDAHAADSIAALRLRLQRKQILSNADTNDLTIIDTLDSGNAALRVILYSNNTWKYILDREVAKDSTIFEKYWSTTTLFPYREVDMDELPQSVVITLLDSVTSYHCPYQGSIHPNGKFGPRRRRQHQGIDLPLKTGDPIYATFSGRVRISQYNYGGYGNLVIIRHDNGLETYYGHLAERLVETNQWVEAGQIIGLGGSTGRSSVPAPALRNPLLRPFVRPRAVDRLQKRHSLPRNIPAQKSFFSIYSNAGQDFDDEIANEEMDKKEVVEQTARRYHTIRKGETLSTLAHKYGTTVSNLCRLNGIKEADVIRFGQQIRIK